MTASHGGAAGTATGSLPPFLVILDRDGTIIVDKNYLADPADVVLEQGAASGLREMISLGAVPVVVTNQSGVARGYFNLDTVDAIHEALDGQLLEHGIAMKAYYTCPHGPDDHCLCRKPATDLARRAAADTGLSLHDAFVIGDKMSDVELATAVGARGILVKTGKGASVADAAETKGYSIADDLMDAARLIKAARSGDGGSQGTGGRP